jgi:hypothetical protein
MPASNGTRSTSAFWTRFERFTPNPNASVQSEFDRLARHRGWRKGSPRYRKERQACLEEEFQHHYGRFENKTAGWMALCEEVGIKPVPASITQCKKERRLHMASVIEVDGYFTTQALNRVWVNLVDLIDSRRTGKALLRHPSRKALREYTIETDKIFSRKAAKRDGFLKALLIHL